MIYLLVAFIAVVMHIQPVLVNTEITRFYITYWEFWCYWKNVLLFTCAAFIFLKLIFKAKPKWVWCFPILYLIEVYLSCYFSEYPNIAWNGYYNYREGGYSILCYPILMIGAMSFADYKKISIAIKISVLCVGFCGISSYLFGQFYNFPIIKQLITGFNPQFQLSGSTRPIMSTLMNANHLGLYCSLLMPFFMVKKQYFFVVILLFLTIGCESRAAWLSVFLTCVWFVPSKKKDALALIPLLLIFHSEIFHKFENWKSDFRLEDKALSGRIYIWKNTMPLINRNEMFSLGKGSSTFSLYFNQYDVEGLRRAGWSGDHTIIDRPHNMYLQMIHASGWISCFLFLTMNLIFLLSAFFIGDKRVYSIAFSVLGFLICGFFTDSMVGVSPIYWVLLGTGYKCLENINPDPST